MKTAAEYDTDELVVQLVRVQHLTERVFQFNQRDQFVDGQLGSIGQYSNATNQFSILQTELQQLEGSIPQTLKGNCLTPAINSELVQGADGKSQDLLSSHYSTLRVRLFEPLLAYPCKSSLPYSTWASSVDQEAFKYYHTATVALRTWLETWLAIPVCYYFYMPQPGFGHLIFAVAILVRRARLLLLARSQLITGSSSNGVNLGTFATETIPTYSAADTSQGLLVEGLESLAARFVAAKEEIGVALGVQWKNDLLDLIARKIRARKSRIEKWTNIIAASENLSRRDTVTSTSFECDAQDVLATSWPSDLDESMLGHDDLEDWLWSDDMFLEMDAGS